MAGRNRKFGDWGERQAEAFLCRHGYEIISNNYQKRCGEIDLIAKKDGVLHFIEVKTRTENSVRHFGLPQEAVSRPKQKRIISAALTYIAENESGRNISWQMDVISIICYPQESKASIELIENAFTDDTSSF